MFFGLMAVAAPVAAVLLDNELAALEATGGSRRINILIAMAYKVAGRSGVFVLTCSIGLLCAILCYRAFRSDKTAKIRNDITS